MLPQVSPDLSHFEHIVPCGIADAPVTSVARLQQSLVDDARMATMDEVQALLLQHMSRVLDVELVAADPEDALPEVAALSSCAEEPMPLRRTA